MFSFFNKRKVGTDGYPDEDYDTLDEQQDSYQPSTVEHIIQEEDEGEDDTNDWVRIIPINAASPRRKQQVAATLAQQQQQLQQQQQQEQEQQHQRQRDAVQRTVPIQAQSDHTASHGHESLMDRDEALARQIQQEGLLLGQNGRTSHVDSFSYQEQQPQRQENPFNQTPRLSPCDPTSPVHRISVFEKQRQMQRQQMGRSIHGTYVELVGEQPDKVEEDQIKRAIELSMLDHAIVPVSKKPSYGRWTESQNVRPPHVILGISEDATKIEIKVAYRNLCKLHHPDRNGGSIESSKRFQDISHAFQDMMRLIHEKKPASGAKRGSSSTVDAISTSSVGGKGSMDDDDDHFMTHDKDKAADITARLKSTAHWDKELQDHRRLVNDLFQADGMDLDVATRKQKNVIELLALTFRDAGATNRNERNEIIYNSCFYLSLAVSSLWGIGVLDHESSNMVSNAGNQSMDMDFDSVMAESEADSLQILIGDQALSWKRGIEACVAKAHPEWAAQGMIGENVQAFSDFLVYALDTSMREMAIVVFDTTSGFVDIYKGKNYDGIAEASPELAQCNTLTLRYIPGHYQPLIPSRIDARRPILKDVIASLDNYGVIYVVTDGN